MYLVFQCVGKEQKDAIRGLERNTTAELNLCKKKFKFQGTECFLMKERKTA